MRGNVDFFGGVMGGIRRGLTLVGLLIAIATGALRAAAQIATTTVSDTVYRADLKALGLTI